MKSIPSHPAISKGFTLVEMSIVLIIIGIILGAVIKGKDLIRSGEQKKIYSNFVQQWQIVYQNYFDRTGWILGDDASDDNTDRDGLINNAASETNLVRQLRAVGIDPPPEGPAGVANQRNYGSADGTTYSICLNLQNNAVWGNHIELRGSVDACATQTGLPNDLAIALDNIIDGQRDGTNGEFQYDSNVGGGGNGAPWPDVLDDDGDPVALDTDSAAIIRLPF